MVSAQQTGAASDISRNKSLTNDPALDRLPVDFQGGHRANPKSQPFALGLHIGQVAFSPLAQGRVGAEHQALHAHGAIEQFRKLTSGNLRQLLSELQRHNQLNSGLAEQVYLVLGCGKVAGKGAGAKHGHGAVGKGDNGRRAGRSGPVNEMVEQVTVAQMHAIEHADRQHRVLLRREAGQTLAEAHRFCGPLLVPECLFACNWEHILWRGC